MAKIRIFVPIFIFITLIFQHSFADEPLPVNISVYSSDENIKKIAKEILIEKIDQTEIAKIVEKPTICKLVVVLEPTKESNINPNGVAISIAHANAFDFFILHTLAQKLDKNSETPLQKMINDLYQNERYTLEYINVAHVDKPTREKLSILFSAVVKRFLEKQVLIYKDAFK